MKIFEITQPRKSPLLEAVGRDLQHIEDLVFIDGSEGAIHAVQRLQAVGLDSKTMTVKWDGSPAIKFGRDEQGQFHFADKHSKELITSPEAIAQQVMGRNYAGKGDPKVDASRAKFAKSQSDLWQLYEAATPKDFRGFVSGDLMWSSNPPMVDGECIISPNTVIYSVDVGSELGRKMLMSKSGVALHFYSETFDGTGTPITNDILSKLGNAAVVILGPKTTVDVPQASVDSKELEQLGAFVTAHASEIDSFLSPVTGLSNVAAVVYKYVNSNQSSATVEHFIEWAKNTLSAGQFSKISAKDQSGLAAIFEVMHRIVKIKISVIDQLEARSLSTSGITARLKGTNARGGEGLVLPGSQDAPPLKFVNRDTFSAANKIR